MFSMWALLWLQWWTLQKYPRCPITQQISLKTCLQLLPAHTLQLKCFQYSDDYSIIPAQGFGVEGLFRRICVILFFFSCQRDSCEGSTAFLLQWINKSKIHSSWIFPFRQSLNHRALPCLCRVIHSKTTRTTWRSLHLPPLPPPPSPLKVSLEKQTKKEIFSIVHSDFFIFWTQILFFLGWKVHTLWFICSLNHFQLICFSNSQSDQQKSISRNKEPSTSL